MVALVHARGYRVLVLALLAIGSAGFAVTVVERRTHDPGVRNAPRATTRVTDDSCVKLANRLCADVGAGSSACGLAQRQTAGFLPAHCDGMLDRYAQVIRELEALDEGVRALTATEQRSLHGTAPSLGAPTAPLTLVEFCDFESSDCARASPMARSVSNLYADRVRLVFRQYPSKDSALGRLAAEASLAAHAQGKFWEYEEALFANPQDLSRTALERYAASIALDMKAFRRALDAHDFADDVSADVALGHRLQALDRPSLFANGKRVPVPYGVSELARLVDSELAQPVTGK